VTVWKGQRWITARTYLDAARRLENFSLVSGALVRRVVIRNGRRSACGTSAAGDSTPRGHVVKSY